MKNRQTIQNNTQKNRKKEIGNTWTVVVPTPLLRYNGKKIYALHLIRLN